MPSPERTRKRSLQPFFEDTNAPDAPFVQVFPIFRQINRFIHWQLRLEGSHHIEEDRRFIRTVRAVSPEMHVGATAAELPIQVAKGQKIIGTQQNMGDAATVGE